MLGIKGGCGVYGLESRIDDVDIGNQGLDSGCGV